MAQNQKSIKGEEKSSEKKPEPKRLKPSDVIKKAREWGWKIGNEDPNAPQGFKVR